MSPARIINIAIDKGLNLIALSDHNSAKNCPAFYELSKNIPNIRTMFAIEVNTTEEVHCLTIFDNLDSVMKMDAVIEQSLPEIFNDPELLGDQVYVDENDNIIGEENKYLTGASSLSLSQILNITHQLGGLCVPAHIDRAVNSLISQLGFVPQENFDALELSKFYRHTSIPIPDKLAYPLITGSDSHHPDSIGSAYTSFDFDGNLKELSVEILIRLLKTNIPELIINV
jgi:hypothetical protein